MKERALGDRQWVWQAGRGDARSEADTELHLPVRMVILTPFIALVLMMVGATAYVMLRSSESHATTLASRLHREIAANLASQLDDLFVRTPAAGDAERAEAIETLLQKHSLPEEGRAFILDRSRTIVAASVNPADPALASAIRGLLETTGGLDALSTARQFQFDHVTAAPSRETWLTYAAPYRDPSGARDWILITAMPEAYYLAGVRTGNSQAAMIFAIALLASLAVAALLASIVTAPLRRVASAARSLAGGDLAVRAPVSRLEEVGALAESFNNMAARLKLSFGDLRRSEGRLQAAIKAAGLGIWDWDVQKDELIWDDSMYRLYGVRKEEFSRAYDAWSRCVLEEDRPQATADVQAALRGEREFLSDFRIRREDGNIRLIRGVGDTIRGEDGQAIRMVGVNWDITERQRQERERELLARTLGERAKELGLLHAAARLLRRERAFDRALLQEFVALLPPAWRFPECCEARVTFGDLEVTTPRWRDSPWRQSVPFSAGDGHGLIEVEYLDECPAAAEGPFLLEERALLESLAEILVGYIELRTYHEGLEALVGSRTAELRVAKEAAESASRAKSSFLANMSHEIRTPMNAVLGYSQLLLRDGALSPSQKEQVEIIKSSGSHLLDLINDILEMSRIEAGRATIGIEPFDLHALLKDVELMFAPLTASKNIALIFEHRGDLPRGLRGDAGKVRQVLINLLSNAVKFTDAGSITVRSTARLLTPAECFVTVGVEDTGPGIAAEDLARIFKAFDQAGPKARTGGTGLGLAISRNFAHLMRGDLTVNSRLGEGSTFTFQFEAGLASDVDLPDRQVTRLPLSLVDGESSRRILAVDDVPTNGRLLEDLLSRIGFETRIAASGEEAIELHDTWHPDLILMDLRMPGMGGLEATKRLRASGSKAVIVAVTASGLAETEREAFAAGADGFVRKPYLEADLLEHIGTLLGVHYQYQAATSSTAAIHADGAAPSLSELLRELPHDLLQQLREAALQGRAKRLEGLAVHVTEHSAPAAAEIAKLAKDFQYDALVAALSHGARRE